LPQSKDENIALTYPKSTLMQIHFLASIRMLNCE